MTNSIILSVNKNIPDEIQQDIIKSLSELDYEVEIREDESTGPWAFMEYLIPAAITFIITSYFGGFFKELGAQTARGLLQTIKNTYKKLNESNPKLITSGEHKLLKKDLDSLSNNEDKNQLMRTHKYGKPVNLIAFQYKGSAHQFTARFVIPSGLTEKDFEGALSSLVVYSNEAEMFLLSKQNIYLQYDELRKQDRSRFNDILIKNGYRLQTTTVFYYSLENNCWINTEKHLIKFPTSNQNLFE